MMPETTGNFDPMKRIFFIFCAFCFSFPLKAEDGLASHQAVYDIALASTAGGAASVVNAKGKMFYKIQKVCGQWQTESVFSLDIGYELSGPDTTNWKQTTRESADGCLFDFEVFVREKGEDRKDLAGSAVCQNGKKVLRLTFPVRSEAVFPKNVVFPVQQTIRLLKAARLGKKNVSAYVYDGTRPEALYSVNAAVSAPEQMLSEKISGDTDLVAGKKAWRFDTAFFEEFSAGNLPDGAPSYEVSLYYYENGVSDKIVQDFGTHRLLSTLTELRRLPDLPCQ